MKNLMDFCIGTPVFWLLGFGLMFGGTGAFIGGFDPLVRGDYSAILPEGVPLPAFLIFQTVFCATAATIVSRRYGRENQILLLLHLQSHHQRRHLSHIQAIGPGAAVGFPSWAFTILPDRRPYIW